MKKVLIDENLPRTLVSALGPGARHATEFGSRLSDEQLWLKAREQGFVLLTKDADFFDKILLAGAPPQIVWVRTGNLRRAALEQRITGEWASILALLETSDLVEIHPDRLEGVSFD